jgi:hypothetical protein
MKIFSGLQLFSNIVAIGRANFNLQIWISSYESGSENEKNEQTL